MSSEEKFENSNKINLIKIKEINESFNSKFDSILQKLKGEFSKNGKEMTDCLKNNVKVEECENLINSEYNKHAENIFSEYNHMLREYIVCTNKIHGDRISVSQLNDCEKNLHKSFDTAFKRWN